MSLVFPPAPSTEIKLVRGGSASDERGRVDFVNDFPLAGVKRFYLVENAEVNRPRAWHGHKIEAKAYFVLEGRVIVGVIKIDDWALQEQVNKPAFYELNADEPTVLVIPGGYANGFVSLDEGSRVLLFSDFSLQESKLDDIRFPVDQFGPWPI